MDATLELRHVINRHPEPDSPCGLGCHVEHVVRTLHNLVLMVKEGLTRSPRVRIAVDGNAITPLGPPALIWQSAILNQCMRTPDINWF